MRRSSIREPPSALSIRLDTLASFYVKLRCLSKNYEEIMYFTESSMTEPTKKRRKGKQSTAAPEGPAATTPTASANPIVSANPAVATPPTASAQPDSAPQPLTTAGPEPKAPDGQNPA